MKIAAIANEGSRRAIASKGFAPGVEWVWVDSVNAFEHHRDAILYADLDFIPDEGRIRQLRLLRGPVLIHSVAFTLAGIGTLTGMSPLGKTDPLFIRINGWPGLLERTPCELAVRHKEDEAAVATLFAGLGWPCRFVPDIPGMISGRILAAIINEAYFTLQDGVSTKEEIDEAMRLGTHYPAGPFEWSRRIGLEAIYELLLILCKTDSKYCPPGVFLEELQKVKI